VNQATFLATAAIYQIGEEGRGQEGGRTQWQCSFVLCLHSNLHSSFIPPFPPQELYGEEDGSVPATFQVVYMIGWAPHESQPQPKKRGSGKVSLKTLQKGYMNEGGNDGSGGCSKHK
jgi:hypothetical protein